MELLAKAARAARAESAVERWEDPLLRPRSLSEAQRWWEQGTTAAAAKWQRQRLLARRHQRPSLRRQSQRLLRWLAHSCHS